MSKLKQTKPDYLPEIERWARWRWEFMRHNRKVRAAWKAVVKLRARAQHPPGSIVRKRNVVEDLYCRTPEYFKEVDLCRRFPIPFGSAVGFPNPNHSFDQVVGNNKFFGKWTRHNMTGGAVRLGIVDVERGVFIDNSPIMEIRIDFSKVNSLEDLKALICDNIDLAAKNRMPATRKNATDYDRILKVGELHREGYTGVQIAEIVFDKEFKSEPENSRRKVSALLKKYHALVAGDYEKMTFP